MTVYAERLNIANVLALPFNWACVDVSLASGASGTDVDDIIVSFGIAVDPCVGIPLGIPVIAGFGFETIVDVSNDEANGTFDVWSANGASGTYGANGTFSPTRG